MRRGAAVLACAAALLAGCSTGGQNAAPPPAAVAPGPAGMTELETAPVSGAGPDGGADEDCDPTASLRPFPDGAQARAAVAAIRERGRLIVGTDIGSNLFSFRDPRTGDIAGFDIDIAGEVARDVVGSPAAVDYRILSEAERMSALQDGSVDIVVKTMTITCQRRALVNFSTVYFDARQRILAPRSSPIAGPEDLSGKRVCVARGSTSMQRVEQIAPPPVLVTVVSWADCLVALQQRDVDAVSTDDALLAGLAAQDPSLHIVGPDMADNPYGIGVNLGDTGLVRVVNGTLERIRTDGTWDRLYRKWLTVLGPAPEPPAPRYSD